MSSADAAVSAPLAIPELRRYLAARLLTTIAIQSFSVAVGWQLFAWTHSALALGLLGLAQFLPMMALTPIAGDIADRTSRRGLAALCLSTIAGALGVLAVATAWGHRSVAGVMLVAATLGAVRAFTGPALSALVPEIVPLEILPRALALTTSTFQVALVIGPAVGGFVFYRFGAVATYGLGALVLCAATLTLLSISPRPAPIGSGQSKRDVLGGLRFIVSRPVLLGALSLDLFAVLLGGAVALLPAVTQDILHVGPRELGWLRSAPAVGAACVGLVIARRPIERHIGRWLLSAVAAFGAATIGFGLSRHLELSIALLVIAGASDMVSVVLRQSLIQLETPDPMRGRVSAVSQLFVGASNELGELESGVTAAWLGVPRAIVAGGIGTLVVIALWMRLFPGLLHADRFTRPPRDEESA